MKHQLYLAPALMLVSSIAWSDPYHGGYRLGPHGIYGNPYGGAYAPVTPTNRPPVYGYQANPYAASPYSHYATPHLPYSAQQPYGYAPYSTPNPYRPYINPYAPDADNTRYDAATPYESGNAANLYGVYGRAYTPAPVYPYPSNPYGTNAIINPGAVGPSINNAPIYYPGYLYGPNSRFQHGTDGSQIGTYRLGLGIYGR